MPRTIDSIVENHQVARERRNAGKPVWDHRINIKEILFRNRLNETNEHAATVGNELSTLLKQSVPKAWLDISSPDFDDDIDNYIDWLSHLKGAGEAEGAVLEDLNSILDQLYDWADHKRVWLGL